MAPISPSQKKSGKAKRPLPRNQRATVRYRCPPATAGRVYLAEDVEFQRAWLLDLSAAGIGLLLNKPLERGLLVTIQLKSPNSKKDYSLPAHIVHATEQSSGDWVIGCALVKSLTNEDLDDLL